jgi:hypothetical protein
MTCKIKEVLGLELNMYQVSAVRIEYSKDSSFYSLIPNKHLALAVTNSVKVVDIMKGTPTNLAEGKRAWTQCGYPPDSAIEEMVWIIVDYESFKEHWFIPQY